MTDKTLPPYQRHSATSKAAAKAIKPTTTALRLRVFAHLTEVGAHGATDEQIADALDMAGNTERPRRGELVRAGLIQAKDTKRKTRAGRLATVWHVVHPRQGGGLQACPCPHCGEAFNVSNWRWVALPCAHCREDVRNPLSGAKRGRKSRAEEPSRVELRVYVSTQEARDIAEMAHMRGESVSAYLRFCFEDRQRLMLARLVDRDLKADNRTLLGLVRELSTEGY